MAAGPGRQARATGPGLQVDSSVARVPQGNARVAAEPTVRLDRSGYGPPCGAALEPREASLNSAKMTGIRTRNETLLVGVLLTVVGGFLDAYTFVGHAVFANAQTGNVVLFGVETASRHWHAALLRLVPIAAFVIGVVAAEVLGRSRLRGRVRRPLRVALGAEIVILAAVASLPDNAPTLVVTVPVAFAASIQWSIFPSTLLASGILKGMGVSAFQWIVDRDLTAKWQAVRFDAVVGAFVVGQ